MAMYFGSTPVKFNTGSAVNVKNVLLKEVVCEATPETLADIIANAQPNTTINLTAGNYDFLLTLTNEAHNGIVLNTLVEGAPAAVKFPENLTIIGKTNTRLNADGEPEVEYLSTMAGISITSGAGSEEQYTATDTLANKLPGGLTLKDINLSNSICLRNCTMDGLNILDCHFASGTNINIYPNVYSDKFGQDSDTSTYTNNAGTFVSNVIIKGNTIEDASVSEDDTNTTAIRIFSVNNVEINSNIINKAAFNGVQVNSKSGSNSTGKIGISSNTIKNTGSRSIRISNLKNAKLFVCSNNLYDANLVETDNEEQIKVSDCYNTTYSWSMTSAGGGSNSYRKDGKVVIKKLTVGKGITLEKDVNTEWNDDKKAEVVADVIAALPVYNGEVVE